MTKIVRITKTSKRLVKKTRKSVEFLARVYSDNHFRGNRISRVLRRIFEYKFSIRLFGINLIIFAVLAGVFLPPSSAFSSNQEAEIIILSPEMVKITTEKTFRIPLETYKITQRYSSFHHGFDLAAPNGTDIYPIMDGVVESAVYNRFSYGNHLIINHGSGIKSLYAHLSRMLVRQGDAVNKGQVIGKVGTSGWSTGPHLHLEIYQNDQTINPDILFR